MHRYESRIDKQRYIYSRNTFVIFERNKFNVELKRTTYTRREICQQKQLYVLMKCRQKWQDIAEIG